MRPNPFMALMTFALGLLMFGETPAVADQANPYQSIVDRNAFGLREPPPPPPPPEPPPPPPVVRPVIKLKGWTSLFTKPRALIQITEQGEKPQNLILSENERQGEIEVQSIDMEKNVVVLSVSGFVTNVTFAKNEDKPARPAGRPGVPGVSPVRGLPTTAAATAAPSIGSPTLISSRNNPRSSVTLLGGSAPVAPPATVTPTAASYNASATAAAANRVGSLPTRSVRTTGPNSIAPPRPQMSREEVMALIEAQRATRPDIRSIFPPTPATPPQ